MTDKLLSDEELKALLADQGKGKPGVAADRQGIRVYDFRQPKLFIQEHTRTIEAIHKDFGGALSSVLAVYFDLPVQIILSSIREQSYGEFFSGIERPVLMVFLKTMPSGKYNVLEIKNDMAQAMIDRVLGGEGKAVRGRALTAIETALTRKIAEKIVDNLNFSWQRKVEKMEFALDSISIMPEQSPVSLVELEQERVFTLRFEMKVGLTLGEMNLSIAHSSLRPVLADMGIKVSRTTKAGVAITPNDLNEIDLPVSIAMDDVELTMGEFMRLQKGDVIPIMPAAAPFSVRVGNEIGLWCRLGRIKNKKAVQLLTSPPEES